MDGPAYAIGLDFGTASARTLLLDLSTGEELAVSELAYADGVIDVGLPGSAERLPPDWALQNPADYTAVLGSGIAEVLQKVPAAAERVIGIGLDFTSCTVLPVTAAGARCAACRPGGTVLTPGPSCGSTTPPSTLRTA